MQRRGLVQGACAAAVLGAPRARAQFKPAPVVVWFTVEGAKGMRKAGERFTAATGVPLVARGPTSTSTPTTASASGSPRACCTA